MTGGYVSPMPTMFAPDYADRDEEQRAPLRRMHAFIGPRGETILCRPRFCRECWREANWNENGEPIMTEKQTSDDVAALAARVLAQGNPLDSDQFVDMMKGFLPEKYRSTVWPRIEAVLKPHFEAMVTLAASCVSQADGPEA